MFREISIGRDQSCDIVVNPSYQRVSGKHCIVYQNTNGDLVFRDNSRNGTLFNGHMLSNAEVIIHPGSSIVLGGVYPLQLESIYRFFHINKSNGNSNGMATRLDSNVDMPNPANLGSHMYSEQKNLTDVVDDTYLDSFHWGAFIMFPIWGFRNGCSWAFLLSLLPLVGNLVFGFKGMRWAWNNRKWNNFYEFRITQNTWTSVAITSLIYTLCVTFVYILLFVIPYLIF